MNLTIIAFVFNFIISCWPKTNVISRVLNNETEIYDILVHVRKYKLYQK